MAVKMEAVSEIRSTPPFSLECVARPEFVSVVVVGVSGLSTEEGGACEVDGTLDVSLRNQAMIRIRMEEPFDPTWEVTTSGRQRRTCHVT